MRKIAIVLCIAFAFATFCSCSTPDFKDEYTTPSTTDTDPITDPATDPVTDPITNPATEPVSEPASDNGKTDISLFTYRDTIGVNGTSFKEFTLPVVSIKGDKAREDIINAQIDAFCQSFFKRAVPNANSLVNGGAVIEFKIESCEYTLLPNGVLSVAFYSHTEFFNAGFEELPERSFAALNISLIDGKILQGADIFTDLDKLKADAGGFKFLTENVPHAPSAAEISDAMAQYRADYMIYPYVYFTQSDALVCVELTQLQGNYALVVVPFGYFGNYFTESFSLR